MSENKVVRMTDSEKPETELMADRIDGAIYGTIRELAGRGYYYSQAEVLGCLEIVKMEIMRRSIKK